MAAGQKEEEEDKFNNELLSSLGQLSFCCQIKISVEFCISFIFALIWLLGGEWSIPTVTRKSNLKANLGCLRTTKKSTKTGG